MNQNKVRRKRRLAIYILLIPMIIGVVYYSFFSVDRYLSTSQVVVRQAGHGAGVQQMPGLSLLLGGVNPASREETLYLRQFIDSNDMLAILEKKLKWREHYAEQTKDPLFWLNNKVSQEDLLDFYRRLIKVHYDDITGLLSIEVQALTPQFAREVQNIILAESERFVNEISHSMAREQMRFSDIELAIARKNYEDRREILIRFQSENNLLDAQASAESRAAIVADLEGRLTSERATLTGLLSQLSPEAPQVKQQRNRINALDKQLAVEKSKLVSLPEGGHLNVIAAEYRNLMIDARITEEAYKVSVSALENARIEASKKIRTLVVVVSPSVPEEAVYPRRFYNLFTLLIALLLVYGITRFIIASIEDHRD